jgi:hypothetical protein
MWARAFPNESAPSAANSTLRGLSQKQIGEVSLDHSPTPVWFCLVYVPGTKSPEQAVVPGTQE